MLKFLTYKIFIIQYVFFLFQSEKESFKQQSENIQKETFELNNEIFESSRKINELERENTSLKLKLDEVQQNSKKEIVNLKLENAKERGSHNTKIQSLNNELEGMICGYVLTILAINSLFF